MRKLHVAAFAANLVPAGCQDGTASASADDTTGSTAGSGANDDAASVDNGTGSDGVPGDDEPGVDACRKPSHEVYLGLSSTCEGCHGEGSNFPAFASFDAFESLVVGDPTLVAPGDPEASALLGLLAGTAAPPLRQMPPGVNSFVDLEDAGSTEITMEQLRDWISALEPCDVPVTGGSPRFVRRVDAEHIPRMLYAQLDLTLPDVLHPTQFPIDDPTWGVLSPADNSESVANARWMALGGPDPLRGQQRQRSWSPLFIQTLGPMAQAWCRRSIELERAPLFRHADADSDSSVDAAAIKANIRYLYLHMLGVEASDTDVASTYESVYLHYEATADSTTAWTAVCAALVRDPLWLTL